MHRTLPLIVSAIIPVLAVAQSEPSGQTLAATEVEDFRKKAFSVCLEAKDYMVKC